MTLEERINLAMEEFFERDYFFDSYFSLSCEPGEYEPLDENKIINVDIIHEFIITEKFDYLYVIIDYDYLESKRKKQSQIWEQDKKEQDSLFWSSRM